MPFKMPTIEDFENPSELEELMPSVLQMVIAYAVKDMSSQEILEVIESLDVEDDSINGSFSDRYDLGELIYEAFEFNDIEVQDVLSELITERKKAEDEANRD